MKRGRTGQGRSGKPGIAVGVLLILSCLSAHASKQNRQQKESASLPALVQVGKSWRLRVRLPDAAQRQALDAFRQILKTAGAATTVPVALPQGAWLPATILPDDTLQVVLGERELALLTPGTNRLNVQLPGWRIVPVPFDAAPLFAADADLRALMLARLKHIPLAQNESSAARQSSSSATPATASNVALRGNTAPPTLFAPSACPGMTFAKPQEDGFPVSADGHATRTIAVNGMARKVYLLLRAQATTPLASNVLGRITVQCAEGTFAFTTLRVSLDLSRPNPVTPERLNARGPVTLPLAEALSWRVSGEWLNIVEVDLGEKRSVTFLQLDEQGANTRLELRGVTLLSRVQPGHWAWVSARARALAGDEPMPQFAFDEPTLAGWETTGNAWGVTDTQGEPFARRGSSRWFADSKAGAGEPGTGTILSPPFTLRGARLTFLANGHGAKNYYALVDAKSGVELVRAPVPEKTGPFVPISWIVAEWKGRSVRFKAVDMETGSGYAWIAFDAIAQAP